EERKDDERLRKASRPRQAAVRGNLHEPGGTRDATRIIPTPAGTRGGERLTECDHASEPDEPQTDAHDGQEAQRDGEAPPVVSGKSGGFAERARQPEATWTFQRHASILSRTDDRLARGDHARAATGARRIPSGARRTRRRGIRGLRSASRSARRPRRARNRCRSRG